MSLLRKFFDTITGNEIDDDFYDELEETLILADVGASVTEELIDELKELVHEKHIRKADDCRDELKTLIAGKMSLDSSAYDKESEKSVFMIVGVNGVGKTTTCGKLGLLFKRDGRRVLLAAADTFRAAAAQQLNVWSDRVEIPIITGTEGADPGSVIFDACNAAKARNTDILICDTAGRLHNKKNLMAELKKLYGIIDREYPEARRETLVVLDATTGQNALEQARQFSEIAEITGIVLTKTDGTAKGGIAVAIHSELGIPVKYEGFGEKAEDIRRFDVDRYVDSLFA